MISYFQLIFLAFLVNFLTASSFKFPVNSVRNFQKNSAVKDGNVLKTAFQGVFTPPPSKAAQGLTAPSKRYESDESGKDLRVTIQADYDEGESNLKMLKNSVRLMQRMELYQILADPEVADVKKLELIRDASALNLLPSDPSFDPSEIQISSVTNGDLFKGW
jgi:hypothetical protein